MQEKARKKKEAHGTRETRHRRRGMACERQEREGRNQAIWMQRKKGRRKMEGGKGQKDKLGARDFIQKLCVLSTKDILVRGKYKGRKQKNEDKK
jgi:hypothetical protein